MSTKISPQKAELMGVCMGDGCISITERYKELAISGDIKEDKEYYQEHLIPLFNEEIALPTIGKKIKGKEYTSTGVYGIITFNEKIVNRMLELGLEPSPKINNRVPQVIRKGEKENRKAFIRGIFDTDGSIYFQKNYNSKEKRHKRPRMKIECVSKNMIEDLKEMHRDLGFKLMERGPYKGKKDKNPKYGFEIYRKDDIKRWIKEIGFNNPKHKTKVEIWGRYGFCPPNTSLKKRREILKIGIDAARLKTVRP